MKNFKGSREAEVDQEDLKTRVWDLTKQPFTFESFFFVYI